jgi:IS30 family transposase
MIGERPALVERRGQIGHWEIDTMMGESLGESSDCILTLVERKTGYVLIGKFQARTAAEANRAPLELMTRHPGRALTITANNGTEFHWYGRSKRSIREYLPKGQTMVGVTRIQCDTIAEHLNHRPRKRHAYKTPHQDSMLANPCSTSKLSLRRFEFTWCGPKD